jgi:hypothetical protein
MKTITFSTLLLIFTSLIYAHISVQQVTNDLGRLLEKHLSPLSLNVPLNEIRSSVQDFQTKIGNIIQKNLLDLKASGEKSPYAIFRAAKKTVLGLKEPLRQAFLNQKNLVQNFAKR